MGPLNDEMKRKETERQGDIKYRDRAGRASASISTIWSGRAFRPTSPASSARPRSASMSLARATSTRRRSSSTRMRGAGPPGDGRGGDGRGLVADLCARQFRRDARADRAGERGGAVRRHVHQPYPRRRAEADRGDRRAGRDFARSPARRPKSITSSSRAATIGARSMRRSPGSRRRGRAASRSPPTCTPIRQARPASTPPCRSGSRKAGSRPGSSG